MLKRCICLILVFGYVNLGSCETVSFGAGDDQFEIEFVQIANPGNPNNPDVLHNYGSTNQPDFQSVAAVDYTYSIGKFEVSRRMVEKAKKGSGYFLNQHD